MAETLGDATLYLDIDDAPLAAGLASTELLVGQRLQTMAAQVVAQNTLITGSFATALAQTTASIDSAFAGWTATFSAEQSALSTQSNQLFTDFTIGLLNHSTTLTTSLIAGGDDNRRLDPQLLSRHVHPLQPTIYRLHYRPA